MLNEKLKELKESKNMTTKELSIKSGIPESTISRILSGQTESPYFNNICDLVTAMDGSVDELIGICSKKDKDSLSNNLVEHYERDLNYERKLNKMLIIILVSILGVVLVFLIFDLFNGRAGYIRY